ncbi:MAG: hypothetical protein B5M56_02280, partial [Desulfococcus sp. 4484_241]
MGGSGTVAVDATGFGNVITNRVDASITGSSVVTAGADSGLLAEDDSTIRSVGLSVSGSGTVSVGFIAGANVI